MSRKLSGFTRAKQDEYLQLIRQGMRRGAAADVVFKEDDPNSGVAGTRRRLMREYIMEHPDFERAVLDAEVDATEHVQEALYLAATSGNVAASKAWLDLHGFRRTPKPASEQDEGEGQDVPSSPPSDSGDDGQPVDPFADLANVSPIRPRSQP